MAPYGTAPLAAKPAGIPIERFLPDMDRRTFRKGEVLFRQGDPADALYYIAEGAITLTEIDKKLGPGDIIGEMGLICPSNRRTVSAVCECDVVAYRMDREVMLRTMDRVPRDVFTLIQMAVARYTENLEKETAARTRMESELAIAKEIQASSLPNAATELPAGIPLDLVADMDPAREVGGDFYDFFMIDDHRLFVAVGDVSGKGVPAALFMMTVKTLLKTEALRASAPELVLNRVNRTVCSNNATSMFVTVLCATVDLGTGRVLFGNAGHCPPILGQGRLTFRFVDVPPSPVLGFLPEATFTSAELTLGVQDALLFYTDGVTEATDPSGRLYGDTRLLAAARAVQTASMGDLVAGIRGDIREFTSGAPQSDDLTMLAVRRRGAAGPEGAGERRAASAAKSDSSIQRGARLARCRMEALVDNFPAFHAVVANCGVRLGLVQARLADIDLAVEEVLANIASYAYPDSAGDVEMSCYADECGFRMEFVDWGIPFDVLARPPPVLPSDIAKREIGGLGIHLVKQTMDQVSYRREGDRNVLALTVFRAGRKEA
jgi:sigma-B regulation protein RsbU (phosphoserine phosphatase)